MQSLGRLPNPRQPRGKSSVLPSHLASSGSCCRAHRRTKKASASLSSQAPAFSSAFPCSTTSIISRSFRPPSRKRTPPSRRRTPLSGMRTKTSSTGLELSRRSSLKLQARPLKLFRLLLLLYLLQSKMRQESQKGRFLSGSKSAAL